MLVKDPLSRITLSEIKQDDFYRVNKIFMETDYNLNEDEKAAFAKSADAVRSMNSVLASL